MDFRSYSRSALQAIILSRLEKLKVFREESILLIAAKIAAISGDARRALEISSLSFLFDCTLFEMLHDIHKYAVGH